MLWADCKDPCPRRRTWWISDLGRKGGVAGSTGFRGAAPFLDDRAGLFGSSGQLPIASLH